MDLSEDDSENSENENGKIYFIIIYIKRKFK